jgi:hypothetical protein
MRVKLLTMGAVSVVISALVVGLAFASGSGAQNANKSGASAGSHKKAAKAAKPAEPAGAGQAAAPGAGAPKAKAHAHHRVHERGEVGVPTGGPGACVDRLGKLAEKDPLVPYEGAPSRIVNDGLLWNDPHSKCAVTDEALREKVFNLATAWQQKQGDQVRSIIGELKSAMPPPAEHKPAPHKRRKHMAAKPAAASPSGPAAPSAGAAKAKTPKGKGAGNSNSAKK